MNSALRILNYRRADLTPARIPGTSHAAMQSSSTGGRLLECLHDWVRRVRPDKTISAVCAKCGEKR